MFQGRHFLGIWQILHVGEDNRIQQKVHFSLENQLENQNASTHTHEHAYVNRAYKQEFSQKDLSNSNDLLC